MFVACQGKTFLEKPACSVPICIDIVVVSPDLQSDCFVDISDLSIFGQSYNKQVGDTGYNACCDFNDDDWCDLSDFSFLGEHYQHGCF
jgi:hypothetical protein